MHHFVLEHVMFTMFLLSFELSELDQSLTRIDAPENYQWTINLNPEDAHTSSTFKKLDFHDTNRARPNRRVILPYNFLLKQKKAFSYLTITMTHIDRIKYRIYFIKNIDSFIDFEKHCSSDFKTILLTKWKNSRISQ